MAIDPPYAVISPCISQLTAALSKLSSICVYLDSLDVLWAAQQILETHPNVRNLQLDQGSDLDKEIKDNLLDTDTQPGLISRTLSSLSIPFKDCPPFRLTSIMLVDVNLPDADRHLKKTMFSQSLKYLDVERCSFDDVLFSHLSQPQHSPVTLKRLSWISTESVTPQVLTPFEQFLGSLRALTSLHVELTKTHMLPNVRAITHAGRSLQFLLIQCRESDSRPFVRHTSEDLHEICTKCTSLRQLSIAVPDTELSSSESSVVCEQTLVCPPTTFFQDL